MGFARLIRPRYARARRANAGAPLQGRGTRNSVSCEVAPTRALSVCVRAEGISGTKYASDNI